MINFDGKSIRVEGFLHWDSDEDVILLLKYDPKTTDLNFFGTELFKELYSIFENEIPGVCLHRRDESKDIEIPDISMSVHFTDSGYIGEQVQTESFEGEYTMSGHYVGYSERTPFTNFTIDTCTLGGHDLITELKSYEGKYINMIIEI